MAPPGSGRRRFVCRYFAPSRPELAGNARLFRLLGVGVFGRFIPTGGIAVRRATGAAMKPYTLHRRSLQGARDFYYRTCVFEALHLPFFLSDAASPAHPHQDLPHPPSCGCWAGSRPTVESPQSDPG
jgi:hypothetical protein